MASHNAKKCSRIPDASMEARAVYLSWLIHLVGDLHQPLHCATLVNDKYPAPIGDKGGNNFYIRPPKKGVKLHSVWDQALGSSIRFDVQYNYATELRTANPRSGLSELTKAATPKDWSLESRQAAIDNGYLGGKLQGNTTAGAAVAPPDDYTKKLKDVAEHRASLAGYRLADEIVADIN